MKNRHTQRQNISYEILYRKLVYHRGSIVHCDNADQDTHVIMLYQEKRKKKKVKYRVYFLAVAVPCSIFIFRMYFVMTDKKNR